MSGKRVGAGLLGIIMLLVVALLVYLAVRETPVDTVRQLTEAVRQGDIEAMEACYTGDALKTFSGIRLRLQSPDYSDAFLKRMSEIELVSAEVSKMPGGVVRVAACFHDRGRIYEQIFELIKTEEGWKICG